MTGPDAEEALRAIAPAAARRRPGDRVRQLLGFGTCFILLILALTFFLGSRQGGERSSPRDVSVAAIGGVDAERVLRAIRADPDPQPQPEVRHPLTPAPLPEWPVAEPVAPHAPEPDIVVAAMRRKAESTLLVFVHEEPEDAPTSLAETLIAQVDPAGIAETALEQRLRPTRATVGEAEQLGPLESLILQGTLISCVLETAISSAVPGLVTCRVRMPVYSADGSFELLPPGSRITGEYQGGIEDGQARIFVLWNRLVTPDGVAVELASPGAGPLGRGGHGGHLDRKWGDRIAAAMMVSVISDAAANAANGSFAATRDAVRSAAVELVQGELAVRSELTKNQGERITVIVARDLDFARALDARLRAAGAETDVRVFDE